MKVESATPILFVRDVIRAAAFYRDNLGFMIDFLHGDPAFYGSVARNAWGSNPKATPASTRTATPLPSPDRRIPE